MIQVLFGGCLVFSVFTLVTTEDFELNGFECGKPADPRLIINGTAAKPGQFPWMVRLSIIITEAFELFCGGAIITRRHVLTAAHCLSSEKGEMAMRGEVYYGSNDFKRGKKVQIEKMMPHRGFKRRPWVNDIAILLVKEPFLYSDYVRPLCLPPSKLNVLNRDVVAAGWGRTDPDGSAVDLLRYTTVKVLPGKACEEYGENWTESQMLCTFKSRSGVCKADSGGPLFLQLNRGRFVQAGIASYVGDGCVMYPQVFTRVDAFMPWIKKNIGKRGAYISLHTDDAKSDGWDPVIPYRFTSNSWLHPYVLQFAYPTF